MIRHLLCRQPAIRAGSCACSPANWTRAVVTEISCETVRRTLKNELISWSRIRRCYPPVSEAKLVVTMEAVLDLYGQPYDASHPVIGMDEPPKQLLAATRTPRARHLRLRIRAAWRLRRLAVRGTAAPVAHRQRYRSAHGGGLDAPRVGRSQPSALPPGRVPDAGVQPPERP